jgi:hypothetical protein
MEYFKSSMDKKITMTIENIKCDHPLYFRSDTTKYLHIDFESGAHESYLTYICTYCPSCGIEINGSLKDWMNKINKTV